MPQQICSLCSDKINDFYEFREMCAATNEQTRKLLGLPEMVKFTSKVPITHEDDDEGVESIFGVMGGDEAEVKIDAKIGIKKPKKAAATATTSKRGRPAGLAKVKKEITVFAENGNGDDTAYSILISDEEYDPTPKKRGRKKKSDDSNMLPLLAPKELNERERQRELEQKKKQKYAYISYYDFSDGFY